VKCGAPVPIPFAKVVVVNSLHRSLVVLTLTLTALAPSATLADTTVVAVAAPQQQAPLDRYFGRLNMSPIGVANAIRHVAERANAKQVDAASAIAGLAYVEDAVKDWEAQYPSDNWLPRTLMSIKHVYRSIDDPSARAAEARIAAWITTRYPASDEAHVCVAEFDARDAIVDAAIADRTDPTPSVLKP
jgi:hypothetical protein